MTELHVTVAWTSPAAQELVPVVLPAGATLACALAASGLLPAYGIDVATMRVGINGRLARLDSALHAGDRVEIYRPLTVDAKEARRARVRAKSANK